MYAKHLLTAAKLVGLSQNAIAHHLGAARSQVNLWSHNKRRVPVRHQGALCTLVATAADAAIDQLNTSRTLGGMVSLPEGTRRTEPTRAEALHSAVIALFNLWDAENREADGSGPTAAISDTLDALDSLRSMTPEEMRKPVNAHRLHTLAVDLVDAASLLERLSPLQNLLHKDIPNGNSNDPTRHPDKPEDAR